MEFACQHRVFASADLEIQLDIFCRFSAEMHLGRGEQRNGAVVVFQAIAAKAVARHLQAVACGTGGQRPDLLAAPFACSNEPFAAQLTLAIEQVDALFVGTGLPGRHPAYAQGVVAARLQVEAAIANIGPAHGGALDLASEHQGQDDQGGFHAALRVSIRRSGARSLGRINRVCHSAAPLSRQYNSSMARVTAR
ncbi:hypothetical protein D3C86_1525400 [compost metagenome]